MLFDEKDLIVFEAEEEKLYFREILQAYHSQNYRATVVLLYSFVIYDLFIKLQTMANDGNKEAAKELRKINQKIEDDEKYSLVENIIIDFFKRNCSVYFDRFIEDVEYLKNCRNKCAHLMVNDNYLFVPRDYQAKMLLCSMYDNILSVKAPFITDLFPIVKADIERYSKELSHSGFTIGDSLIETLSNKFFRRMTYDSLKISYRTFIKLLLISNDDDAKDNIFGLYAFTYALTDFMIKEGQSSVIRDKSIQEKFSAIHLEEIRNNDGRRNVLVNLAVNFQPIMDSLKRNSIVFEYLRDCVLSKPYGLKHYQRFYLQSRDSILDYYNMNKELHDPVYITSLFDLLKGIEGFDINIFAEDMVSSIPAYNGYHSADCFMSFFIEHIIELSEESIKEILNIYNGNAQCINRARHKEDIEKVNTHLYGQNNDAEESNEDVIF